jgi:hypothetical protein
MSVIQVFGKVSVNVVRIGNLYNFESLVAPFVNPAFHGLGHTGWDKWLDGKNPTHIIRFSRRDNGETVLLPGPQSTDYCEFSVVCDRRGCQNGV